MTDVYGCVSGLWGPTRVFLTTQRDEVTQHDEVMQHHEEMQHRGDAAALLTRLPFIGQFQVAMSALSLPRRTRHRLLVCLFLLTGVLVAGGHLTQASAQKPVPSAADTTARPDTTTTAVSLKRKSPGRAVFYSAGGTALLTPVFGIGLLVGPSFGHFYAEDHTQAWRGIALRGGGIVLAVGFGFSSIVQAAAKEDVWGPTAAEVTGYAVMIQALYDVVTAWHSAKAYNEAHGFSARVTPTVEPRGEQVGLALRVSF